MGCAQPASLVWFGSSPLQCLLQNGLPREAGCVVGCPGAVCTLMLILLPQEGLPHKEWMTYSGDLI